MAKIIFIYLLSVAAIHSHAQVPPGILAQIPAGFSLRYSSKGDLNLDTYDDYVLVLMHQDETTSDDTLRQQRMIYIFAGQNDSSWTPVIIAANVVYRYGYDKNFPDCFVDITVKPGSFIIDHYGGFRQRWGRSTTFEYDTKRKNWYVTSDLVTITDSNNPDSVLSETPVHHKRAARAIDKFSLYNTPIHK